MASFIIPVSTFKKPSYPQAVTQASGWVSVRGTVQIPDCQLPAPLAWPHTHCGAFLIWSCLLQPRARQMPPLRSHSHSTAPKDVSTPKRWRTGLRNGWTPIRKHLRTSDMAKNLSPIWEFFSRTWNHEAPALSPSLPDTSCYSQSTLGPCLPRAPILTLLLQSCIILLETSPPQHTLSGWPFFLWELRTVSLPEPSERSHTLSIFMLSIRDVGGRNPTNAVSLPSSFLPRPLLTQTPTVLFSS